MDNNKSIDEILNATLKRMGDLDAITKIQEEIAKIKINHHKQMRRYQALILIFTSLVILLFGFICELKGW